MEYKKIALAGFKNLLIAVSFVFLFTPLLLAYNLEEYYPLNEGNSWTYSEIMNAEPANKITFQVEGKEVIEGKETIKVTDSRKSYRCLVSDHRAIKEYKDFDTEEGYEIFNPPKVYFPDLKIGEHKEYSTIATQYGPAGEKLKEYKVVDRIALESIEDVTVPAGQFKDCLKFSLVSEEKEIGNTDDCSIWFAPGVGKVKQFCIATEYDSEIKQKKMNTEFYELTSAVINGKKIGSQ